MTQPKKKKKLALGMLNLQLFAVPEALTMQPGKLSEGTSYRHTNERGSDKKDDVVPRK